MVRRGSSGRPPGQSMIDRDRGRVVDSPVGGKMGVFGHRRALGGGLRAEPGIMDSYHYSMHWCQRVNRRGLSLQRFCLASTRSDTVERQKTRAFKLRPNSENWRFLLRSALQPGMNKMSRPIPPVSASYYGMIAFIC